MQDVLILLALYAILIAADVVPLLKGKDKSYLYFVIPAYLITLVLNLLAVFGMPYPSIFSMIQKMLSHVVK